MPPNPLDQLKDALPVEKIDPQAAVDGLSKTQTGAMNVINTVWSIINIFLFVGCFIYFGNKKDAQKEKDDAKWIPIVQAERRRADQLDSINATYRDSLTTYRILQQFNVTQGEKRIILIPKKHTP